MRTIGVLALALAAVVATTGAAGAGGWCAMFTRGSENCSYTSQQQCLAAVRGLPAFCQPNPFPGTAFGRGGTWGSVDGPRNQRDR
jgi:hypothetical protein